MTMLLKRLRDCFRGYSDDDIAAMRAKFETQVAAPGEVILLSSGERNAFLAGKR
jgi:hypothetical protein